MKSKMDLQYQDLSSFSVMFYWKNSILLNELRRTTPETDWPETDDSFAPQYKKLPEKSFGIAKRGRPMQSAPWNKACILKFGKCKIC